jgi:hypothetical protein
MYHVELRHFPFTARRFNLGDRELLELLDPWVHDEWIDLDERKWSPQQARLTVLEGPEIPVYEPSMGRGWRSAERKGKDVTAQALARARALLLQEPGVQEPGGAGRPLRNAPAAEPATDSSGPAAALVGSGAGAPLAESAPAPAVGVLAAGAAGERDVRSLLGDDPDALLHTWRLVARRRPELTPSQALALAEQTLRSLESGPSGASG